jgi:quercetin dioxygenase-like cupin family protein
MSGSDMFSVADIDWQPGNQAGQPPQFDGEVRRAPLVRQLTFDGALDATVSIVHFIDGARTHWHRHTEEQILIVLRGECRFGTEDGATGEAQEGQVVRLPGGQRHWHGAMPASAMTHISITHGGHTEWFEPAAD